MRFAGALADWAWLSSLPLKVPLIYLALSGLIWALTGSALLWGLWRHQAWAPWATRLAVLSYTLYYWLDRLWLAANGPQDANRPFAFLVTVGMLASIFIIFRLARVSAYFGEKHERTRQN